MILLHVETTVGSAEEAEKLGAVLVNDRLVACFQVMPIDSTFRWQSAVQRDKEWLCLMKTTEAVWDRLEARLKELHSYDVPEIVAWPITRASGSYAKWIDESVG